MELNNQWMLCMGIMLAAVGATIVLMPIRTWESIAQVFGIAMIFLAITVPIAIKISDKVCTYITIKKNIKFKE